jgi:hypothetical protein
VACEVFPGGVNRVVVGIPGGGAEYLDLMHFHFVTEIGSVLEIMPAQLYVTFFNGLSSGFNR